MKRIVAAVLALLVVALAGWAGWRAWGGSVRESELRVEGGWSSPGGEHVLFFGTAPGRGDEALVVLAGRGVVERAEDMASRPSFAAAKMAWLCARSSGCVTSTVASVASSSTE